jgi:hypothetical protein
MHENRRRSSPVPVTARDCLSSIDGQRSRVLQVSRRCEATPIASELLARGDVRRDRENILKIFCATGKCK